MRSYLLRRLLFIVPSLAFLVIVSFLLLRFAPGDPVDRILMGVEVETYQEAGTEIDLHSYWTKKLGLDLPLFYFSIGSLAKPFEGTIENQNWKKFIPWIHFHSQNQFHRWLVGDGVNSRGIIHGDFGISYSTGQSVSSLISERIGWSLFFAIFSVTLAYLISLPIGIKMAMRPDSIFAKFTSVLLIILFSLPVFWTATMLMMLFCNPDVLYLLPASGVEPIGGFPDGISFFNKIKLTIPHLIIPTICYTYGSLAIISRIFQLTISDVLKQDFIRTARAKGLPEKTVVRKHAFRNTLLPVITVFSSVFPAAIGGSVILESIFSIPGMGLTIYQSVEAKDYPVLIAVFLLTGIITMSGFLLSDILYSIADPRVNFINKKVS